MRNKTILIMLVLLVTMAVTLAACGTKSTTQAPASNPTIAPSTSGNDGQALLNDRCTKCHSLDRVTSQKNSADQWTKIVSRMVQNGAKLTSDEQKVLVDYLAKTYGQ